MADFEPNFSSSGDDSAGDFGADFAASASRRVSHASHALSSASDCTSPHVQHSVSASATADHSHSVGKSGDRGFSCRDSPPPSSQLQSAPGLSPGNLEAIIDGKLEGRFASLQADLMAMLAASLPRPGSQQACKPADPGTEGVNTDSHTQSPPPPQRRRVTLSASAQGSAPSRGLPSPKKVSVHSGDGTDKPGPRRGNQSSPGGISICVDTSGDSMFGDSPSPKRDWRPKHSISVPKVNRTASATATTSQSQPSGFGSRGIVSMQGIRPISVPQSSPARDRGDPPSVDSPQSSHAGSPAEEEVIPQNWEEALALSVRVLGLEIPSDEPKLPQKASILEGAFGGIGPLQAPKPVVALPADGIIDMSWDKMNKSLPRVPFSDESRLRKQYRWPESDFDRLGKVPMVDKSVSTYLATKLGGSGKFKPRSLFSGEIRLDKTLQGVDHMMRAMQRMTSHLSYMLVALRGALAGDSQWSEEDIATLLGAMASATCDISGVAVNASARCTQERRQIYVDALNLPDRADRATMLKVPMGGAELFNGKFSQITQESSQLRRDAKEMAETLATTSDRESRERKRKPESSQGQTQFKRFRRPASPSPKGRKPEATVASLKGFSIPKLHVDNQNQSTSSKPNRNQPFRGRGRKWHLPKRQ